MKKGTKVVLIGFAAIVGISIIASLFDKSPDSTAATTTVAKTTPTARPAATQAITQATTPKVTVALSESETVKKVVYDAFGEKNILTYEYNEPSKGLFVTALAEDNLTKGLIRTGIETDLKTVLKSLKGIAGLNESFVIQFPLVDVKGNTTNGNILLAEFSYANIKDVNWDSFLRENFSKIADAYWVHPDLEK